MINLKHIKLALAKGETELAIENLLNEDFLPHKYENDLLLLSNQLENWKRDYRMGLTASRAEFNRISAALLEITDRITTLNDLRNEQLDSENPTRLLKFDCLYNSSDKEDWRKGWTIYNTKGIKRYPSIKAEKTPAGNIFKIQARGEEDLGMEKPINRLIGSVELEYLAVSSAKGDQTENLMLIMIPMQHNTIGQTGYIEVGSSIPDDSINAFSPYRKRFIVPQSHIGDKIWHQVSIEFDFRYVTDAFYTIFAPRINEGVINKGKGELWFRNIKIYG